MAEQDSAPPAAYVRLCLDCREEFTLTDQHRQYFLDNGLVLPKRCRACRVIKRRRQAWWNDNGA